MSPSTNFTRRTLLRQSAYGAAALVYANSALSAGRVIGANDRIVLGLVGCGSRGVLVARNIAAAANNATYFAVCDVSDQTVNQAKSNTAFAAREAEGYKDFRKILDRNDIDAVHVATPDHWHAAISILACQSGKDVYVEKPLALTIREGRLIVNAARKYNRIVQHGTQHRSAPHYAEVERIIQSGEIGDVHFVRVWNYAGSTVQAYPDAEIPAGVDWDMYLGPAPKVPYNRQRFQGTFRRFYDYSGGFITDFGAHRLDSVHQVMHDDRPLSALGTGGLYMKQGIEDTPDVIQVTYEYKNWVLSYEGIQLNNFGTGPRIADTPGGETGRVPYNAQGKYDRPHGEAFYGTKGTIFSDRVGFELFPAGAGGRGGQAGQQPGARSVAGADRTDLHAANFIECMRTRKAPAAEAEIGHMSSVVCHLGNISYRVGSRKIRWDPEKEEIVGDAEASKMLWREMRKPWDLISNG